jgi:hypothetical protein
LIVEDPKPGKTPSQESRIGLLPFGGLRFSARLSCLGQLLSVGRDSNGRFRFQTDGNILATGFHVDIAARGCASRDVSGDLVEAPLAFHLSKRPPASNEMQPYPAAARIPCDLTPQA